MTSHPIYQYCKCQFESCSLRSPHPPSPLRPLPHIPFALSLCMRFNVAMYVGTHQI